MKPRQYLIDIANDFQNNYLTVARYAECNELTVEQATLLIALAQDVGIWEDLKVDYTYSKIIVIGAK